MFRDLESAPKDHSVALHEVLAALKFNSEGLVAAVAQDARSKEVLMVAT